MARFDCFSSVGKLQPPIADYALIGDTRTAALCSRFGSIDWMAVPRFDSKPVFSRLVDEEGGRFSVEPPETVAVSRRYTPASAIVETTWTSVKGRCVLREGMVVRATGGLLPQTLLVRNITCEEGSFPLRILYSPVHGFDRQKPSVRRSRNRVVCSWDALAVSLQWDRELDLTPGEEVQYLLGEGETLTFVLSVADRSPLVFVSPERALELMDETERWWQQWSDSLDLAEDTHHAALRSFITLRLLTYSPTAAPVAAPTTSLPEKIGGSDNWDYRFSWPRDASIGLVAFLGVGRTEEAHAFMHWLVNAARQSRPRIDVLYDIYGRTTGNETEADVSGYRGSLPVRIGNAAAEQHQLDVYGWVLDTAYLLMQEQGSLHKNTWRALSAAADFVAEHWREPDSGIWERRGPPEHYVHSKLMGWLALDRALRIGVAVGADDRRTESWEKERDELAAEIRVRGFNERIGSYVDTYDGEDLDAALLLLPVLEFDPPQSERVKGTIAAIRGNLGAGGALVYRFTKAVGNEGAFLPCCFWLVQALARVGEVDEARELFDQLVLSSNDVGLFAEELDPATADHLGNFPQAFTHATLLQAASAINAAIQDA